MNPLEEREGFQLEKVDYGKKKKKDKRIKNIGDIKIIDDDAPVSWNQSQRAEKVLDEEFISNEEAPIVVGIIDERPRAVREKELFENQKKWRATSFQDISEIGPNVSEKNTDKSSKAKVPSGKLRSTEESDPELDRRSSKTSKANQDASPPRRQRQVSQDDPSPPRRRKPQSDEDPSPPRRGKPQSDDDPSPPRRGKPQSDDDPSPPRRGKPQHNDDPSPPRRKKPSTDDDAKVSRKSDSSSFKINPKVLRDNIKQELDASPPRLPKSTNSSSFKSRQIDRVSPARKYRDSGSSSSRRQNDEHASSYSKRYDSDDDTFSSRSRRQNDSFSIRSRIKTEPIERTSRERESKSPDRKHKHKHKSKHRYDSTSPRRDESKSSRKQSEREKSRSPRRDKKTSSKKHHSREKSSVSPRRKQDSDSESRSSERQSSEEPSKPSVAVKKSQRTLLSEKKQGIADRYSQWGRGLAQVRETEDKIQDFLEQSEKPLARYANDSDLDNLLKERDREDDPMLKYLAKKTSDRTEKRADGTIIPAKPRYKGPEPQKNRFNIWPGYRWDGVDRSNGYERKLYESIASRHAKAQEAYLWSVEDM